MPIETLADLALVRGGFDMLAPLERKAELEWKPWEVIDSGYSTYTGRTVSQLTALQASAVYACIRVMSGDIAKCPLVTYRMTDEGREKARDHYLYRLLRYRVNDRMTAFRFKRLMQTWVMLDGNAYAAIEINGRGQVLGLYPWRPDRVQMRKSDDGSQILSYKYTHDDGQDIELPWYMVFHLRGLETDGLVGLSPVQVARQSIGLSLATEEFAARFYGQGARPGGLLTVPAAAAKDVPKLREEWHKTFGSLSQTHKTAVMIEGTKYEPLAIKQSDAEYIATRKLGIADISRVYGPPLHKLAELDRATFANIEEQGLDYTSGELGNTMANWEQELMFTLLSDREQETIYVEFLTEALVKGRFHEQAQGVGALVDKGVMDRNEARAKYNMNRRRGADKLLVQQQMIPIEDAGKQFASKQQKPQKPAQ